MNYKESAKFVSAILVIDLIIPLTIIIIRRGHLVCFLFLRQIHSIHQGGSNEKKKNVLWGIIQYFIDCGVINLL